MKSNVREICRLIAHSDEVLSVAFYPDGRRAVSSGRDFAIRLWDLSSQKELFQIRTEAMCGWVSTISRTGHFILSGSEEGVNKYGDTTDSDHTLRIWNASNGSEIGCFEGHTGIVHSVAISFNELWALSGSGGKRMTLKKKGLLFNSYKWEYKQEDNSIRLWDVESGLEIRRFQGHTDWVMSVGFSPDCRYVVSGSKDKTVRVWDLESGQELKLFEGHRDCVKGVVYSPDGRYILSCSRPEFDKTGNLLSRKNAVVLWDVESGERIRDFEGHIDYLFSVAFSPDGQLAISGGYYGIRLWDVKSGQEISHFGKNEAVTCVTFSPDGHQALSGNMNGDVTLWDIS